MATPITVAFHVNTNIAPAPYMNENTIAISSTVMLLKKILVNLCMFDSRVVICSCVTCAVGVPRVILSNSWCCVSNTLVSTPSGRTTYSSVVASIIPRNRYMNAFSAFQCSSSSILLGRSCRSFCSSCFIILYISGVAPIAMNATTIMLAWLGKNLYPMSAPSSVSMNPSIIM